jgi:hypothetical protein
MRKWKLEVLVVFVCVVLCCVSVVRAEVVATPTGEKLSNTRTASCMMIVSADSDIFPLWEENINTLVLSTGVGMRAVKEVLGTDEHVMGYINYHTNKGYSTDPGGGKLGGGYGEEMMLMRTPAATPRASSRTTTSRSRPPVPRTPSRPTAAASTTRTPTSTARTFRTTLATRKPLSRLGNQNRVYMTVEVELGDREVPSAAVELLDAFVSNFTEALERAFEDYKDSFDNQRKAAEAEARNAEVDVMQLQHELRDLSGSRDLSPQVVREDIRRIRTGLEKAMMSLTSYEGDTKAYSMQIAKNEMMLKEKLKTDVILKELERVVQINQEKEKNLRDLISRGIALDADVSKASEGVARARIELARRKDELSKSLRNRTSDLTSMLAGYAMKRTQKEHEFQALHHRLQRSQDLIEKADQYEIQILKLGLAKRNLEDAIMWRDDIKRQMRVPVAPSVIVMGAE